MNQDIAKGKWVEIKGEIQKTWGNLTGDDLEKTKGDMTSISGLLQQKYGMAKEDATKKVSGIFSKFQEKKDEVAKSASNFTDKVKTEVKNDVRDAGSNMKPPSSSSNSTTTTPNHK